MNELTFTTLPNEIKERILFWILPDYFAVNLDEFRLDRWRQMRCPRRYLPDNELIYLISTICWEWRHIALNAIKWQLRGLKFMEKHLRTMPYTPAQQPSENSRSQELDLAIVTAKRRLYEKQLRIRRRRWRVLTWDSPATGQDTNDERQPVEILASQRAQRHATGCLTPTGALPERLSFSCLPTLIQQRIFHFALFHADVHPGSSHRHQIIDSVIPKFHPPFSLPICIMKIPIQQGLLEGYTFDYFYRIWCIYATSRGWRQISLKVLQEHLVDLDENSLGLIRSNDQIVTAYNVLESYLPTIKLTKKAINQLYWFETRRRILYNRLGRLGDAQSYDASEILTHVARYSDT